MLMDLSDLPVLPAQRVPLVPQDLPALTDSSAPPVLPAQRVLLVQLAPLVLMDS